MAIDTLGLENLLAAGWLQVLRAVIVVVVAIVGLRVALNWTGSAMRRARVDSGTEILVKRGLAVTFVVVTLLVVLGILGVNSVSLVTVAGAVGLAFTWNFLSRKYLLFRASKATA